MAYLSPGTPLIQTRHLISWRIYKKNWILHWILLARSFKTCTNNSEEKKMCGKICHEICDEICDEICHENMLMSKWLFNFSLREWFLYMTRNVTKCVTFSMQNVTKIYNICGGEGWGGLWNTNRTKNVYNEK